MPIDAPQHIEIHYEQARENYEYHQSLLEESSPWPDAEDLTKSAAVGATVGAITGSFEGAVVGGFLGAATEVVGSVYDYGRQALDAHVAEVEYINAGRAKEGR